MRAELDPILRRLKRKKIVKENEDVIADYLARLFMHTKARLEEEGVISDATPIEHVLTVPAIWTAEACRKMQKAMAIAMEQAKFGAVENLFLVSEPEAAASYVSFAFSVVLFRVFSESDFVAIAREFMETLTKSLLTPRSWDTGFEPM